MLKFNTVKLTDNKIDQWIKLGQNVLIIGEKGTGKTTCVLEGFKRNKLKYSYFSGSTLDPWIHLLGIPKVKEVDGKERMEFILPVNLDDDIEALFIDEYNRVPPLVANALLELQQFKSINGRKFPKLKLVWGAINPPNDPNSDESDNPNYQVQELDPAQLDRFHVIVEIKNEPDKKYFNTKYGEFKGKILMDWWKDQSKEAKKILSPRRLDYVGDYHAAGGDINDLLPVSANTKKLIEQLGKDPKATFIEGILNNPTEETIKVFFDNEKNLLDYAEQISDTKFWQFYYLLPKEFLLKTFALNTDFRDYALMVILKKSKVTNEHLKNVWSKTYYDALTEFGKITPENELTKDAVDFLIQSKYDSSEYLPTHITEPKKPLKLQTKSSGLTIEQLIQAAPYTAQTGFNNATRQGSIYSFNLPTNSRVHWLKLFNSYSKNFDERMETDKELFLKMISLLIDTIKSFQASTIISNKSWIQEQLVYFTTVSKTYHGGVWGNLIRDQILNISSSADKLAAAGITVSDGVKTSTAKSIDTFKAKIEETRQLLLFMRNKK